MAKKVRKKRKPSKRNPKAKKRVKRSSPKAKKRSLKKKTGKRAIKKKKKAAQTRSPKLPAEPIGRVTHYFPKVRAVAVMIERDEVRVGDTLYFKGHTTRFKQRVASMQINHQSVPQAGSGDEVGIQARSRCREHDLVFKL